MFGWLQNMFSSRLASTDAEDLPDFDEEESSFVWTEHMRIVLAIVVMIISAFVMWWIMA